MSEYQYYEFQAIDKPFTDAEMKVINTWSSRANVSRRRASFEYSYADFPQSIEKVTAQYFDVAYYIANWGTKHLLFRFPIDLVDFDELKAFSYNSEHQDQYIKVDKQEKYIVLDIYFNPSEPNDTWIEADDLSDVSPIRAAILAGDYRALFAFWLKIRGEDYEDNDEIEDDFKIPLNFIPPNLNKRNKALDNFIDFFEIDIDWVIAASEYSKISKKKTEDFAKKIKALSSTTKDNYLLRLLNGESNLGLLLKKELSKSTDKKEAESQESISFSELFEDAEVKEQQRRQRMTIQKEKERIARLENLVNRKKEIKKTLEEYIDKASGKSYVYAMEGILELQEAAIFQNKVMEKK